MNLLLDTNALLWSLSSPPKLRPEARRAIQDPGNWVGVSAGSVWEIAIKRAVGKLQVGGDLLDSLRRTPFDLIPITPDHAWAAGALPPHHKDPFDRLLIAQARAERLTIVTRDPRFEPYGVDILPA